MIKIIFLKQFIAKIALFFLTFIFLNACNTTKRVPAHKKLLVETQVNVNSKKNKDDEVNNQLYQKRNSSFLGLKIRLTLFNWAKPKSDSTFALWLNKRPQRKRNLNQLLSQKQVGRLQKSFFVAGISNQLKKIGEAPVIFDSLSTNKSVKRLNYYYFNKGFFDVKTSYTIDTSLVKKIKIKYATLLGTAFIIDSLKSTIDTPILDSLYKSKKSLSLVKSNTQFKTSDFESERIRISTDFRNNGAFYFQPNYISYDIDTVQTDKKVNVKLLIKNFSYREGDSSKTKPFKLYKLSKVNIFPDHTTGKNQMQITDSVNFRKFTFLVEKKLKYRPKSITNAIFLIPGNTYSDIDDGLTRKYISNLRIFNFPSITYSVDPTDDKKLIANIYLTALKKYSLNPSIDFTRSNIQLFGIAGNLGFGIKNVFNGAETFEIALRGNLGASQDFANPNNRFFNIFEYGIDAKLNFPRIVFPVNTDKIVRKRMFPNTVFSIGFAQQTNIGLDKQNFTSAFTYNWTPKKNNSFRFDLFNIQFVKNVNKSNYFNIYRSSYNALSTLSKLYPTNPLYYDTDSGELNIELGTNGFLNDVLGSNPTIFPSDVDLKIIRSINERKTRLTENNLIFASSASLSKTSREGLFDENFYTFKAKIESAGNVLSLFARAAKELKNQSGANTIFEVEYSQYIKTEFEYVKHWDLSDKKVVAIRTFTGIAIPYGNSKNVPFSRSYFAGGSNDNRAWQPYTLGPGSSGGINDFNEANLKIALNAEFRFNIVGKINGGLFADAGNIWNVLDNVTDQSYKFKGISSLQEIAIGTGFGLRYDQGLFVLRLDLGFKTFNPAKANGEKWGKEFNFTQSVINIGINYPF